MSDLMTLGYLFEHLNGRMDMRPYKVGHPDLNAPVTLERVSIKGPHNNAFIRILLDGQTVIYVGDDTGNLSARELRESVKQIFAVASKNASLC